MENYARMLIGFFLIFVFGAAAGVIFYRALRVPGISTREMFYRCLVGLTLLLVAAALLFFGFLAFMELRFGPLH